MKLIFSILMLTSIFSVNAFSYEYYCSRSDIYFKYDFPDSIKSFGVLDGGLSGYSESFIKDSGSNMEGKISIKVTDCSNTEYQCLQFMPLLNGNELSNFYLFIPQKIETNKEYIYKGMRLVTKTASISQFLIQGSSKFNVPTIQAIIWQTINGIEVPHKLTIEQGKGVTFWDGLNIDPQKYNVGESCVLQSTTGFFSKIKIEKIKFSGKSKTD